MQVFIDVGELYALPRRLTRATRRARDATQRQRGRHAGITCYHVAATRAITIDAGDDKDL